MKNHHPKKKPRHSAAAKAAVQASGISVHCHCDEIRAAEDLKPYPGNWKKHPPAQLDRYEHVVEGNGWRRAIVVSKLSGCITKGHGAWQMAKRRGWDVPVEFQAYATRAEEIRDLVADNKLAELAVDDDDALRKLLDELDPAGRALAVVSEEEFAQLLRDADIPEAEFPITAKLGESYDYVLIFTTNATEYAFLQNLVGLRAERSYKKTGVGLGRAIPLERALAALRANRHSLDVQGGDDDHAPAPAKRQRVRADQPARSVRGSRGT